MAVHADERTPLLPAASRQPGPGPDPAPGSATPDGATTPNGNGNGNGIGNSNGTTQIRNSPKTVDTDAIPSKGWLARRFAGVWSPANRVLLAGFIISLSFSFTQVSIFYVFRLMECDVYYDHHPPFTGVGDRCSRNEIAAGTATQFSILGMSTTFCGTWNLFVSGHQVKKWGPRAALILQTSIPAVRVATQIVGVVAGGQAGIWIIQLTQVITVLGGPAGYILVVNTIAGEVVPPIERTALFGKLQGCIMLGLAIGFLLGGLVGDTFGIIRPFQVAFFLFCFASVYARGLAGFFQPLKVLAPQSIRLSTGRVARHYGVFFLCSGVFLGLATGYAPVLLQMYATAVYDFDQANNGWLMAGNGFMRAVFLIFLFPRIIDAGRAWFSRLQQQTRTAGRAAAATARQKPTARPASSDATTLATRDDGGDDVRGDHDHDGHNDGHNDNDNDNVDNSGDTTPLVLPTEPEEFAAPTGTQVEEEPLLPHAVEHAHAHEHGGRTATTTTTTTKDDADEDEKAAYAFDLFFLRWSLLVDGVITAGAALATRGWHMYLVTLLLPFGSGSAPAAKGVITTMCPASQRTDALNAITLVENIARLATLGLFGFIFSALAAIGQSHLTFYCNGAVAVIAMLVLMLSHFPPLDSELVDEGDAAKADEPPQTAHGPNGAHDHTQNETTTD
ncbi:Major facilitator superfamily domain, general substrate transporter [Niveomyces insectorum RCEF 264]|uniref:Major facilitator superfamily domain, general substrate transporter n=1 Tax=Niveomyces insectorum RCEF 264 TaxID=1081102 RepID=A0A167SF83_9HYPO|nr:Major facilitator superfamily domain, general substrate transporter [Niveomyces insectorum RCEF 264]